MINRKNYSETSSGFIVVMISRVQKQLLCFFLVLPYITGLKPC